MEDQFLLQLIINAFPPLNTLLIQNDKHSEKDDQINIFIKKLEKRWLLNVTMVLPKEAIHIHMKQK